MSNTTLKVQKGATINAPVEDVWNVLTQSKFIRQWDQLPEGFKSNTLELGTEINWPGDHKLTVTGVEIYNLLELNLYDFNWPQAPGEYNVTYSYSLEQQDDQTVLYLEIGDFSEIPEGEKYFLQALKFAESALGKIQELAEQLVAHS